jgi:methylmalonyl-CoA epimerase
METELKTTKINHLGVAVQDIEATRQIYEAMGLEITEIIDVPEQKVRVAFIPIGESTIELVQPTDPDSTVARYLQKWGPGLHHLALGVEDIHESLSELRQHGSRLIDEMPRQGAEGQIAFLHPKSTDGVLIELVEPEIDSEKGDPA